MAGINAFLEQIAPQSGGSYAPVFAANTVDGGFWTASLEPEDAASASSRIDLSIIATYTNTPASYPTWTPSVFSDTVTVDLETLYASTLSTTETAAAKVRRKVPDEGSWSDSGLSYQGEARGRNAESRSNNSLGEREPFKILKRDPGTRVVRQPLSPKDLSVLAWAPGVPSVDNVDYIFSERKGENTWVYVLDTGVNAQHLVGNTGTIQWLQKLIHFARRRSFVTTGHRHMVISTSIQKSFGIQQLIGHSRYLKLLAPKVTVHAVGYKASDPANAGTLLS